MKIYYFFICQFLWYLFATVVGFAAAILFWNKGSSQVDAKTIAKKIGIKLTGASAIFVAVIIIFHFINPLDPQKIWIVYSDQPQPAPTSSNTLEPHVIKPSQMQGVKFDHDNMVVEMIPVDYIYDLSPRLEDKSFMTRGAIPTGIYRIRFVMKDSGESKQYTIMVP